VVDRVVEDVLHRLDVLLFGLDHLRPEALPKDVVLPAVPGVERARVLAVQVAHPVREIRERCLDDEVVVVPHQAADVEPPAVAAADAREDVEERQPVGVVAEDRRVVVALRRDVVVRAGLDVAVRSTHAADGSADEGG
jgi:hypothetical protein